jgi:orotidine-5'-phosphate decarboxylase
VLTSLQENDLEPLGISVNIKTLVSKLAKAVKESGLDGVVASAQEAPIIKKELGENFLVVTPGIRPEWAHEKGDQKRVATPKEAIKNGSDFIVIGRPIIANRRPAKAAKKVLEEISS